MGAACSLAPGELAAGVQLLRLSIASFRTDVGQRNNSVFEGFQTGLGEV